jgi:hypothetical protein
MRLTKTQREKLATLGQRYIKSADPTVNDDSEAGYARWDKWLNQTSGEAYVCTDATAGAAVWQNISLDTEDLASMFDAKADKDTNAVAGNLAQFDANGNPIDSTIPAINIIRSKVLMDDVFGLEWHKASNSFTRLFDAVGKTGGSDFDIGPWASMQRCNMSDAGVVNAYHGDIGFDYTGTNGEVMTEMEKFYYQMYPNGTGGKILLVSPWPNPGFKKYPAWIRNGQQLDYIYPSSFEGFYDSVTGMMRSIANVVPSTSDGVSDGALTPIAAYPATTAGVEGLDSNGGDIRNCRYWAQARGINWEQYDFLTHSALCMLAFVEYGTFDLQTAIGLGVVNKASGTNNNAELTGQTAGYAGGTDLGNASGQIATNGLKSMSYRGVENLYGNIWKWVDGLNIKADNDPYISDHGFESDKFTDPYYQLGVTLPSSNGYGGDFVLNDIIDFGFLTSVLGGASNSGLFDYYYQSTGNRVALVGGSWNNGLTAGPLRWSLSASSANASRIVGGRSLCLSNKYIRS